MNALTPNRAARKAAMSEYEKNAKEHAEHVAQSVLALMAYIKNPPSMEYIRIYDV